MFEMKMHEDILYLCYDCSAMKNWSEKRDKKHYNMISVTYVNCFVGKVENIHYFDVYVFI